MIIVFLDDSYLINSVFSIIVGTNFLQTFHILEAKQGITVVKIRSSGNIAYKNEVKDVSKAFMKGE